jgi:hypothetical protein
MNDHALGVAVRQTDDLAPGSAFRNFLDGEVELVTGDKIDCRRCLQAADRIDCNLGADKAGFKRRIGRLECLDRLNVGGKRRRRRVQHGKIVIARGGRNLRKPQAVRRRIDQFAVLDQCGRLRQPGRIPERADFPPRLIARAGAAIEALKGGRLQK